MQSRHNFFLGERGWRPGWQRSFLTKRYQLTLGVSIECVLLQSGAQKLVQLSKFRVGQMTDVVTDGSEEQFSCDFNVEVDIDPLKGRVYCHCKLSKNLRINFCWKMFVLRLSIDACTYSNPDLHIGHHCRWNPACKRKCELLCFSCVRSSHKWHQRCTWQANFCNHLPIRNVCFSNFI